LLVALENVQPPPDKGLASLWRLVVLEQRTHSVRIHGHVRRSGEQARRGKVGLPFVLGCRRRSGRFRARLVAIAVSGVGTRARMRTGTSRGRRAAMRRIHALVVATIAALASISIAVPLHFLRALRGAVVLVRALIVSAHVPAVPVPIPPLSAIIMGVVVVSSSVVVVNKPVCVSRSGTSPRWSLGPERDSGSAPRRLR
jgi:hypothetical protein